MSTRKGVPVVTIDVERLLLRALLDQTSVAGRRSFTERTDRGKEGAIEALPNRTRADIAHFSAWHLDAEMRISTWKRRSVVHTSCDAECRFPSDSPAKRSRCVLAAASQDEPQTRTNESKMLRVACITTVAGTRCN